MTVTVQARHDANGAKNDDNAGFHRAFANALMDENPAAFPAGFDPQASRRFAIYRNNVHRGLQEALAAAYPVVKTLVGEGFFYAIAAQYMRAEGKRTPSLALYGKGFARFLAQHEAIAPVPYIPDVARLERAWLEALHEADAPVTGATDLAGMENRLAALHFTAHPAARLIVSDFPIVSLWRANQPGVEKSGSVAIPDRAETALITRPHFKVQTVMLDAGACVFARALLAGMSVGAAYEGAVAQDPAFDVTPVFAQLLASGMFCGFTAGDE
ncbi:DNA-binding domain-containing protein [Thalassospira mesophila]|uniref:HvfC/BufC N-terminal domain-containing protein n=1 Tax=Thalassospira mesophila TaxID=1293891 RepID=UPI000A1E9B96|nr:DNA-binding domain-containing protein [Thalassospira mesophila]